MMAGFLTTHVLDTARGRPAAGVAIELVRDPDGERSTVASTRTNADGRTDAPLVPEGALEMGEYELLFDVGAYFAETGLDTGDPAFLGRVPVRFAIDDADAHYHVPLLVSPWSYATYRGS
jgi:5-hydroxyisourate hydrolase